MQDAPYLMTAADCAHRIGTTVKALRVYEEHGLLRPQRSASNWRLYGTRELTRLNEILAFKAMGFSLGQIKDLVSGGESDPEVVLRLQQQRLTAQQQQFEKSVMLVSTLRAKIAHGEILSINDLLDLAKETQMNDVSENDIAWKRYEQMRPRVEIKLAAQDLVQYGGHYQFEEGLAVEISVEGEKAWLRMTGQPRVEMFAEAPDRFFLKVVAAQVSFTRADGIVNVLTLHQNGREMRAHRTDLQAFERIEEELIARSARDAPREGSEKALQQIIEEHRLGTPAYDAMTPLLADVVREQLSPMMDELARLGALKSLQFLHVDGQGFDVFDAVFENGVMEFGLSEDNDGVFDGLFMRHPSRRGKASAP